VCVCLYARVYVCAQVRIRVCACLTSVRKCLRVCLSVRKYPYCVQAFVCVCVCARVSMCVCTYVIVYACTYARM
jgi:hypothetical protein